MIDEVIFLSSQVGAPSRLVCELITWQSSTAASIATTFNLCSIGTFLLSHGSLVRSAHPRIWHDAGLAGCQRQKPDR
eukprot:765203-Hanusia_phi.AAC.5